MNKKSLLLAITLSISSFSSTLPAPYISPPHKTHQKTHILPQLSDVHKSYIITLLSGGLVGTLTSKIATYAITKLTYPFALTSERIAPAHVPSLIAIISVILVGERELCTKLMDEISRSFDHNEIKHEKKLAKYTALITSWLNILTSQLPNQ